MHKKTKQHLSRITAISIIVAAVGLLLFTAKILPHYFRADVSGNPELLIESDASDGSTTFDDSSSQNHTITAYGDVKHTTELGLPTSVIKFDGSGDYLSIPDSDDFYFGSGDFTIDFWVNFDDLSTDKAFFTQYEDGSDNRWLWYYDVDDPAYANPGFSWTFKKLGVSKGHYTLYYDLDEDTWYHFAFVRNGSDAYFFVNGVSQTFTQVITPFGSNDVGNLNAPLQIGDRFGLMKMSGYMDEIRITKGKALWTSNFTPPDKPAPDLVLDIQSDTTDGSTTFEDSSLYENTIVGNGGVQHSTELSCDTTAIKFDGTDDNLEIADSPSWDFSSGEAYTIDGWFYPTDSATNRALFGRYSGETKDSFLLDRVSGYLRLYVFNSSGTRYTPSSSVLLTTNTWHHIALVQTGTTLKVFQDGNLVITQSCTQNISNSIPFYIGDYSGAVVGKWMGYVDNFRITKGEALWTDAFIPPNNPCPPDYCDNQNPNTVLSVQSDNTNLSTTFVDSSIDHTETHTITVGGNAHHSTDTAAVGDSSMRFDGDGDYLSMPDSADWLIGSSDFTISFWFNIHSFPSNLNEFVSQNYDDANDYFWDIFYYPPTDALHARFAWGVGTTDAYIISTNTGIQLDTWYHFALVRESGTANMYLDGIKIHSESMGASLRDYPGNLYVGYFSSHSLDGYIDDLNITKEAVWTGNFTPPTSCETEEETPCEIESLVLDIESDTTDGSTTFEDSSTQDHTITANGGMQHSTSMCSSASVMAFDGSDSYLTVPESSDFEFGSENFTIDFWIYENGYKYDDYEGYNQRIFGNTETDPNQYSFILMREQYLKLHFYIKVDSVAQKLDSSSLVDNGAWHHVAIVRNGSDLDLYVDGVSEDSADIGTGTVDTPTEDLYIGNGGVYAAHDLQGWMDNFRIHKGEALWTEDFTPLDHPCDASFECNDSSNTVLLVQSDDSDGSTTFSDSSLGSSETHTITANGDAQHSTDEAKFGNSSIKFDGNGDYLSITDSDDWDFGSGDFTIDFWVNYSQIFSGINNYLFDIGSVANNKGVAFVWVDGASDYMVYTNGISVGNFTGNPTTNTWYHIAITRESTNVRLFINGQQLSTTKTDSRVIDAGNYGITVGNENSQAYPFSGYIDEFSITKGKALWTYNFTPPSQSCEIEEEGESGSTDAVLYLEFEDNWEDSSGNEHHGSGVDGAGFDNEGRIGKGSAFDGVNDCVEIPDSDELDIR